MMPLPGPDSKLQFPAHHCNRSTYRTCLLQCGAEALLDGLGRTLLRDWVVRGEYRQLISRPLDLSWEFRSYKTQSEDLTTTDWDTLKPKEPAHQSTGAGPALLEDAAAGADGTGAHGDAPARPWSSAADPDASYKAAILQFSLPPKTYPTMLLRELCVDQRYKAAHALAVAGAEQPEVDGPAEACPGAAPEDRVGCTLKWAAARPFQKKGSKAQSPFCVCTI